MIMPNFLIIGSAKAGTSSLYYYLKQHPQIYMSPLKEPKFFAFEGEKLNFQGPAKDNIEKNSVTTLEEYQQLFADVNNEIAIGEASPIYIQSPKAAQNIKRHIPNAKIIAVLRNPAERAFSAFSHLVREGHETLSFEEALKKEKERIFLKWVDLFYYQQVGFYHSQLEYYFKIFEREQIKVYLYDDLEKDTLKVVQNIFAFLNVDSSFVPDLTRKNVSGIPKSRFVYDLFTKENSLKSVCKPLFSNKVRRDVHDYIVTRTLKKKPKLELTTKLELIEMYKKDILSLQSLIDCDLSMWFSAE